MIEGMLKMQSVNLMVKMVGEWSFLTTLEAVEAVEGGVVAVAPVLIQKCYESVVRARSFCSWNALNRGEVTVPVAGLLDVAVFHLVVMTIRGHLTVDVKRCHIRMEMALETDTEAGAGTEDIS
ncbi:hypothetical protein Leryth_010479 [Lithospermum erythrorhizon]|nr:hypothetical protein Leryth_010479 [Lithospermum erythrorhizon]